MCTRWQPLERRNAEEQRFAASSVTFAQFRKRVRAEKEAVRPYACAALEGEGGLEWALRTPEWGYLLPERTPPGDAPRGPQLYVKPDDRW